MGSSAFSGLGSGNAGIKRTVRQMNSFSIGDVLRFDGEGGSYTKASADTLANAEVVGVVEDSTSSSFTIVFSGEIDLSGWADTVIPSKVYFLQKTPVGKLDVSPPTATGTIKKTVMIGSNDDKGIIVNYLGLVNGIDSEDLVDLEGVQPVGSIMPYGGIINAPSDIPDGWLLCDGSQFSSVEYPELSTLIQNTYGTIEGLLYRLPDLRARTPIGINTNNDATEKEDAFETRVIGSSGGAENHPLGIDEIPSHDHSQKIKVYMDEASNSNSSWYNSRIDGVTYSVDGDGDTVQINYDGPIISNDWTELGPGDDGDYGLIQFPLPQANAGGGEMHNNMQPYLTINYIIRAKKQAQAAILTVNLQDLADVDNNHSCANSCIDNNCNSPRQGDTVIFNGSPSNSGTLNVGHGTDKFVVTSSNNYDRNVIINGNFNVWQRGTSWTGSEADITGRLWTADRWNYAKSSTMSAVNSIVQQTSSGDDITKSPWSLDASSVPGLRFLEIRTTTPKSTIASSDYVHLNYFIEGNDMRPLWSARCMTLSFFVRSKTTGTYSFAVRNSFFSRSYVSEYTISQQNTWEWKTITIPLPESSDRGNWNFDEDTGMRLTWTIAGGSDYQTTTPNTWLEGGNAVHTSNQVNGVGTVDTSSTTTFQISQVQLESGSVATPFQEMRIADEITRCERYYEKSYQLETLPGTATSRGRINENDWVISPTAHISTTFRTRKQRTPDVTIWNPSTGDKNSYTMTHKESGSDTNHVVSSVHASETNIYSITRDLTQSTLNSGYKNKLAFQYEAEAELS